MERGKHAGSSSSPFTSYLFGSKEPSSSVIFGSIFAHNSPKVLGRESLSSEAVEKNQDSASKVWNSKPGAPDAIPRIKEDAIPRIKEGESQSPSKKDMSSYYNEQKVQPCHLSSSIYYGGQDIYSNPQITHSSGYSTFNKDGGEDESGSASRGNWWQGSLYY